MTSIPIMCMVCGKSVKDNMFPQHMASIHGGQSQSEAMMTEKNIPNQPQPPIVLNKDTPPTDEFMEVAAMLDKPKETPPVPSSVEQTSAQKVHTVQEERNPLVLKYRWEGNCEKCNVPVRTVVVKAKGQTVAVALCLDHGEVKQREVAALDEVKMEVFVGDGFIPPNIDPNVKIIGKEVKKHDKRSKPKLQHKASVQSSMPASRLQGN